MHEHKIKVHAESFSAKYNVDMLVWYESGEDISAAIELEKKIKNRAWKITLIEKNNPNWNDLAANWGDSGSCDFAQDDTLHQMQDDGHHQMQDDVPHQMQDDVLHQMQDNVPHQMQDNVPHQMQDDGLDKVQDDAPH